MADEAPEVGFQAVALVVKQALGSIIAARELQEDRRQVYGSRLSDGRESLPWVAETGWSMTGGRLLSCHK